MKLKIMKRVLYILAVLLSVAWIIGFFIFSAGMFIHCVLVVAILLYLQGVMKTPRLRTDMTQ
jgi:hypothetical protein